MAGRSPRGLLVDDTVRCLWHHAVSTGGAASRCGRRRSTREESSVRFVLDEARFLPPLDAISDGPSIGAGYLVHYLICAQDCFCRCSRQRRAPSAREFR
jgi:hypothetical protein